MTSSARRDPLRELALLARAPEPGTNNLGEYVADNASELAQVLGIDPRWLEAARATDDEEVVSRIRQLLARARDQHVQQDLERRRQRSLEAAERLGATAVWTPDLGAQLDVDLLLGELLADRTKKWIAFTTDQAVATIIPRHLHCCHGTAPAYPRRPRVLVTARGSRSAGAAAAVATTGGATRCIPRSRIAY